MATEPPHPTSNSDALVQDARTFLTAIARCVSAAQTFIRLQGWSVWLGGQPKAKAITAGETLKQHADEVGEAATDLRLKGSLPIVREVDHIMAKLGVVATLVENHERDRIVWDGAVADFVESRNDCETIVRAELARLREIDKLTGIEDQTVTDLLVRVRFLEQLASEIQGDGTVSTRLTDQLVDDYQAWLADALAWLPIDLGMRLRDEYEGLMMSPKIKSFLNEPTAPRATPAIGEDGRPVKWKYPVRQCFLDPLRSQRQLIVEASRRVRHEESRRASSTAEGIDGLIDELAELAQAAEDALIPAADALDEGVGRLTKAIEPFDRAWSRSNIGPHALMYYDGLHEPPPGRRWNQVAGFLKEQPGWIQADHVEVIARIEQEAGVTITELDERIRDLRGRIRIHRDKLVNAAVRVPHELAQRVKFDERRNRLEELDEQPVSMQSATNNLLLAVSFETRDGGSALAGPTLAPHQNVEAAVIVAFSVVTRARELVTAASRAAATAEGIRHLPVAPEALQPPMAAGAEHGTSTDRLAALVSALALMIVMLMVVAGSVLLVSLADSKIGPDTSRFSAWPLARAIAGGAGVWALVLAGAVVWYGLVRRRADHVRIVLGRPLLWSTSGVVSGVLLYTFGIA